MNKLRISCLAISLLFCSFYAAGQIGFSELNLSVFDNSPIFVTIDNLEYNTPSNYISLKNLLPGNHYLKVIRQNPLFESFNSPRGLCFNGMITIPNGSRIYAYINKNEQLIVSNIEPFSQSLSLNAQLSPPPQFYNSILKKSPNFLIEQEYKLFKEQLVDKSLMSQRLALVKHSITFNKLYAWQIVELLSFLSFESEKIDLAKFAYYYVIDKENYTNVYDAFSFKSSSDEVRKFVTSFF